MYVNEEKKAAFIAHPRTASVATGRTLSDLGFTIRGNHHAFDPAWCPTDWIIFSTVRHPFDLLVSWYYNKRREIKTFQEWLPTFLTLSNQYLDQGLFFGQAASTHVIRFENLQADFDRVMEEAGFPPAVITPQNVSDRPSRNFWDYYNWDLAHLMTGHFGREIYGNGYEVPAYRMRS